MSPRWCFTCLVRLSGPSGMCARCLGVEPEDLTSALPVTIPPTAPLSVLEHTEFVALASGSHLKFDRTACWDEFLDAMGGGS